MDNLKAIISMVKTSLIEYPIIITFMCSIFFFLIVRSSDIIIVFKTKSQRTEKENIEIKRGLRRTLLLEMFLFVPASIILFRLIIFPHVRVKLLDINRSIHIWYALMGIVGYGFPFGAVRRIITRIALNTLKEFASIAIKSETEKTS